MRRSVALPTLLTVLVLVAATAPAGASDRTATRVDAPTGVRTTMVLLTSGEHRIVSVGHAARGAKVVLQNRFGNHQVFGTVASTVTDGSGRFRVAATLSDRAYGKYRTCVMGGARPACTPGARPHVRQRTGRIEITNAPTQLTPDDPASVHGHVTRWLRNQAIRLQYQRDDGRWVSISGTQPLGEPYVEVGVPYGFDVADPALKLRLNAVGTRDVAGAHSKPITVASYRSVPLADLSPTAGTLVRREGVAAYYGTSLGVAPAGSTSTVTTTLALPAGCGRVTFGVTIDRLLGQPGDTYSASVAVDGTTLWSHAPGDGVDSSEHRVALPPDPRQLTLTTSYDAGAPDRRPWFVDPDGSAAVQPPAARVLCTS